jgi:hypothetical protein
MSKYLNLEDVAIQRGETPFKLARLLTKKGSKLFLDFGEDNELLLCITDKVIKGHHHLFQVKKGTYPMKLKSQHECVQRLSISNYDLSGLSFMVVKDEIILKSVDDEDRSVCVVVHPDDVSKLPPHLTQIDGAVIAGNMTASKINFLKNSPISIFIEEQISNGNDEWQKAWKELREVIADPKNTKTEDMKLHTFGEKSAFIRRAMKQASTKLDYAVEYQEDGVPSIKTVARQDFGRMFRKALKKSRTLSDSPK